MRGGATAIALLASSVCLFGLLIHQVSALLKASPSAGRGDTLGASMLAAGRWALLFASAFFHLDRRMVAALHYPAARELRWIGPRQQRTFVLAAGQEEVAAQCRAALHRLPERCRPCFVKPPGRPVLWQPGTWRNIFLIYLKALGQLIRSHSPSASAVRIGAEDHGEDCRTHAYDLEERRRTHHDRHAVSRRRPHGVWSAPRKWDTELANGILGERSH